MLCSGVAAIIFHSEPLFAGAICFKSTDGEPLALPDVRCTVPLPLHVASDKRLWTLFQWVWRTMSSGLYRLITCVFALHWDPCPNHLSSQYTDKCTLNQWRFPCSAEFKVSLLHKWGVRAQLSLKLNQMWALIFPFCYIYILHLPWGSV